MLGLVSLSEQLDISKIINSKKDFFIFVCLYLNISHNYKKINELNINVTIKLTLNI